MRGDFNYSGGLDILDILAIAVYLFQEGEAPICAAEGNVDGMDTFGFPITSLDINYLVDYLFYSGPPPPNCP